MGASLRQLNEQILQQDRGMNNYSFEWFYDSWELQVTAIEALP